MKKLFIISMLFGAMPLAMLAQDDDLYFVPKKASKTSKVEKVTDDYGMPKDTYYSGSDRSVDDYNRRFKSTVEVIDSDSIYVDNEDFKLTKKMSRFDDYNISEKAAYWAGYERGRYDWGWHSPWYFRTYGWYGGPYDPWYYDRWYGWGYSRWYDPWWYSWYDPWYYDRWYGYYRWYDPWWSGGWYAGGYHRRYYGNTGNTGTIHYDGSTHSAYSHNRGPIAGNSQRMGSLRDRAARMGGDRVYSSGNSERSRSGNFSGYRGNSSSGSRSGSYSGSRSSGSYSGSRSSGSSGSIGGGGGSFGGSRGSSGGGGGSRMGGRR